MGNQSRLFAELWRERKSGRVYKDLLSADVNSKGVLDVDVVKGCASGMAANPGVGCYAACYAARIAKARGFDFSVAVTRTVQYDEQRKEIEAAVRAAPYGFFRIGTMGDPSHAWEDTVRTAEWLSAFARAVVITKHWAVASDEQLRRLIACHAVLNTSVSALDTAAELAHRVGQFNRFKSLGGDSVARIVSCHFNRNCAEGAARAAIQDALFLLRPVLDNPLRLTDAHRLVRDGIVNVVRIRDLTAVRTISLANPNTHIGHCSACPDLCGLSLDGVSKASPRPRDEAQLGLWNNHEATA